MRVLSGFTLSLARAAAAAQKPLGLATGLPLDWGVGPSLTGGWTVDRIEYYVIAVMLESVNCEVGLWGERTIRTYNPTIHLLTVVERDGNKEHMVRSMDDMLVLLLLLWG